LNYFQVEIIEYFEDLIQEFYVEIQSSYIKCTVNLKEELFRKENLLEIMISIVNYVQYFYI